LAANQPEVVSPSHIAAIVLVADAHRLPFSGTPFVGTAPYSGQGLITALPGFVDEDIPAPLQNITVNICNDADIVCDFRWLESYLNKDLDTVQHTDSYQSDDLQHQGAKAADIVMDGGSFWG
jgi:hypothetical protein